MNPLKQIATYGQSLWLDYIRRQLIISGELKKFIEEDGLQGMTSNPSIFEKAIAGSQDYDDDIRAMALAGKDVTEIYETLSIRDVQSAADEFRSLYNRSKGNAGFVSLEVNPHLARKTEETITEARRLWAELNRPNVFIKIPATLEGLPAIQQLISEGINVNVTLLFGLLRYRQVAEAYIAGLEERAGRGEPLADVRSVASFFLSRIDVLVDPTLEQSEQGKKWRGEVAIASAKIAYQIYREIIGASRWKKLAKEGAQPQRLLWASTSAKNPDYSEVKYVEPLIGPDTVNTVPPETLNAYRNQGTPSALAAFSLWLEQLLAESSGKEGRGILPVVGEPVDEPSAYGDDRLFVYLRLPNGDKELERRVAALRAAGHPMVTIELADRLDLGQEFFRWEVAIAMAGAALELNPFDQPNVQESKDNTDRLLKKVSEGGSVSPSAPAEIREETFREFFAQARPRDYVALLAYLPETKATDTALQAIRLELRETLKLATTVGYGPRYLHSTGQLHKAGPNTGLFVILTADDDTDIAIPGKSYGFSAFKQAQAQGDFQVLQKHGRRVLHVHLGDDIKGGLASIADILKPALEGT